VRGRRQGELRKGGTIRTRGGSPGKRPCPKSQLSGMSKKGKLCSTRRFLPIVCVGDEGEPWNSLDDRVSQRREASWRVVARGGELPSESGGRISTKGRQHLMCRGGKNREEKCEKKEPSSSTPRGPVGRCGVKGEEPNLSGCDGKGREAHSDKV